MKRLIPFELNPKFWNLEGKDKQKARAKYELEGKELAVALVNIDYDDKSSIDYKRALLEISHDFKEISDNEYEKQIATLSEEPFFKVVGGEFRQSGPQEGTMVFELDWNEHFVDQLRFHGWTGYSDDEIVDRWFEDSCKQMFEEDVIPPAEREGPVTSNNRTRRRRYSDDTNEYS